MLTLWRTMNASIRGIADFANEVINDNLPW